MKMLIRAWFLAAWVATAAGKPVTWSCEVVTAEGKPASGAEVFIVCPPNRMCVLDQPWLASGKTDANGKYSADFETPIDRELLHPLVVVNAGAAGVGMSRMSWAATAEAPDEIKIQLRPAGEFKAKIVLPDGSPAAGIEFWVASYGFPMREGDRFPDFGNATRLQGQLWRATTNAEGLLVLPQVPRGANLYLEHADKRYAQLYGKHHILMSEAAKADGSMQLLALKEPASIRGRVMLPDGKPAAGSVVSIIERTPYVTSYSGQAKAGDDGSFVIDQIPESTYHLHYETMSPFREEWIGGDKKGIAVKAGEVTDVGSLEVTPVALVTVQVLDADTGAEIEKPFVVRYEAGSHELHYRMHRLQPSGYHEPGKSEDLHITVQAGERKTVQVKLRPIKSGDMVRGTVVGRDGKPVAGASVLMMDGHWNSPPPIISGEDGSYEVVCRADARRLTLLAWSADGAMSDPLSVKRGETTNINLRTDGFARVAGRVVDEDGKPIAGARLKWILPGIEYGRAASGPVPTHVETDADGRFDIPRIWAGIVHPVFFVSADGYGGAAFREEKLIAGKTTELHAKLKRADIRIAGVVVDTAGKPLPGIVVHPNGDGQPNKLSPVTTDDAGRFSFSGLSRGLVNLHLWQESAKRRDYQQVKAPNEKIRLVWPDADGSLAGTVVDSEGRPFKNAKIESYANGAQAVTDEAGRFQLEKLLAGWFSATVSGPGQGGETIEQEFRLKPGMKNVSLRMPPKTREQVERPVKPLNLIGMDAPEIQVATWLNSEALPVKAGGKVRILDFWGMECGPCLAGFPKVQAFWAAHQKDGLEIIAHSGGLYPEQEVREFLAEHGDYKFPIALATQGSTASRDYDVRGIPTYVVIDPAGKIVSKGNDWEEAKKAAERLLILKK